MCSISLERDSGKEGPDIDISNVHVHKFLCARGPYENARVETSRRICECWRHVEEDIESPSQLESVLHGLDKCNVNRERGLE